MVSRRDHVAPVPTMGAGEGSGERWGMSVSIEWGGVPLEALFEC